MFELDFTTNSNVSFYHMLPQICNKVRPYNQWLCKIVVAWVKSMSNLTLFLADKCIIVAILQFFGQF